MTSSNPTPNDIKPLLFPCDQSVPPTKRGMNRWTNCTRISAYANSHGLVTTPEQVNRHYKYFVDWIQGRMVTGYLIKRTGVRRKVR